MPQRGRLLVRSEVSANERKRDCGLLPGHEHVERLDSKCATLSLCLVYDANGIPDSGTVA